jgi:predicted RNase H-like HicB family nuclease
LCQLLEVGPVRDSEGETGFQIMIKYEVIIYWSDEDGALIAEVPELPGCMAHGVTQEAALVNAQDAIRLWLDTANEFGDPIPEPKGRRPILA